MRFSDVWRSAVGSLIWHGAETDRPDAGVAPASAGLQARRAFPDDESTIAEDLVREGSEEAEFDTMGASCRER